MIISSSLLFLITAPSAAQAIGGESEIHHQFYGNHAWEEFGHSVQAAGDYNQDGFDDLIIGRRLDSPGGLTYAGSVQILSGIDGTVLQQWNGAAAGDEFGSAVAVLGDVDADGVDDFLIGANKASGSIANSGMAFVYSGATGAVLLQVEGEESWSRFGYFLESCPDLNGDGIPDFQVAAPSYYGGAVYSRGAMYVYSGADGSLLYFKHYSPYGSFVTDVDGDNIDDFIIGNPWYESSRFRPAEGRADLYSGADGSWIQEWIGQGSYCMLGAAVGRISDRNQDGIDDIAISEIGRTSGLIRIFSGADPNQELQSIHPPAQSAIFGAGFAQISDWNQDGIADYLVTDPNFSGSSTPYIGRGMIISGADDSMLHSWVGASASDLLGSICAPAGDLNGDGIPEVILGNANLESGGLVNAGYVGVYGYNPFLYLDEPQLSAAAGGSVSLNMQFPSSQAGHNYKVLITSSGIGEYNFGATIPLAYSPMLVQTFFGNYPITSSQAQGTLDGNASATCSFAIPAGAASSWVGHTFHMAAITQIIGSAAELSSGAVGVTITP